MVSVATEPDTPFTLQAEQVQRYAEDGFVKLPQVLSPELLARYEPEITASVIRLNTEHLPLPERDTYKRAFLQVTNLWQHSAAVKDFVHSRRLARIAAELMGVRSVRLYHDQALYNEAGGGFTPWHVDQHYWPLSTDRTITAWVPLQDTPAELGPLTFAVGSHRSGFGHTLAISEESEAAIDAFVASQGYRVDDAPFALGDVSFHSGWTIHRAPANTSPLPRRVTTIIYLDADIRIIEPANAHQHNDWQAWLSGGPSAASPTAPSTPFCGTRPVPPPPTDRAQIKPSTRRAAPCRPPAGRSPGRRGRRGRRVGVPGVTGRGTRLSGVGRFGRWRCGRRRSVGRDSGAYRCRE